MTKLRNIKQQAKRATNYYQRLITERGFMRKILSAQYPRAPPSIVMFSREMFP